jgi:TPR repeat protein
MNKHLLFVFLLTASASSLAGCKDFFSRKEFDTSTPQQAPVVAQDDGNFAQRQRDCWDMPNAKACFEVGMNYELGVTVPRDKKEAKKYYVKACELDKRDDYCKAAAK